MGEFSWGLIKNGYGLLLTGLPQLVNRPGVTGGLFYIQPH